MICITPCLPDLDDLAGHIILHHFQGLMEGHTAGNEFDGISCLDDGVRVVRLLGGADSHGAFQKVELELYAAFHQSFLNDTLTFLDVFFAVLGEEDTEAALLQEGLHFFGLDLLDLPVVDGGVVPGLVLPVVLLDLALRLGCLGLLWLLLCC